MTREKQLRDACQERCAGFGDPPCYRIVNDEPSVGPWVPCAECLADIGEAPPPEPLDPDAVVRPLL